MKIELKRIYNCKDYCIGKLYIDGKYFCDTLEDTDRMFSQTMSPEVISTIKIAGKTAIPTGTYRVDLGTISSKFCRVKFYKDACNGRVPRLIDVPGYSGILIHCGNTAKDTAGCILVGQNKVKGKVINSKETFLKLYSEMMISKNIGQPISITISRNY